jgi:hypothetical protein
METAKKEEILLITYKEAIDFLLPRHYSGRKPNIKYAYGLFVDKEIKAVVTFGIPASPSLCRGVCGEKWKNKVLELNRLCRVDNYNGQLSYFVSYCLRDLKKHKLIVVSYSDLAMNHHGYIYQACNFLYTGATKERTDKYTLNGKHSRHYKEEEQGEYRKVRSSKHRYIYFCADKRTKKEMLKDLRYPILEYPKGDNNKNYVLGNFLKDQIIKVNKGVQSIEIDRKGGINNE